MSPRRHCVAIPTPKTIIPTPRQQIYICSRVCVQVLQRNSLETANRRPNKASSVSTPKLVSSKSTMQPASNDDYPPMVVNRPNISNIVTRIVQEVDKLLYHHANQEWTKEWIKRRPRDPKSVTTVRTLAKALHQKFDRNLDIIHVLKKWMEEFPIISTIVTFESNTDDLYWRAHWLYWKEVQPNRTTSPPKQRHANDAQQPTTPTDNPFGILGEDAESTDVSDKPETPYDDSNKTNENLVKRVPTSDTNKDDIVQEVDNRAHVGSRSNVLVDESGTTSSNKNVKVDEQVQASSTKNVNVNEQVTASAPDKVTNVPETFTSAERGGHINGATDEMEKPLKENQAVNQVDSASLSQLTGESLSFTLTDERAMEITERANAGKSLDIFDMREVAAWADMTMTQEKDRFDRSVKQNMQDLSQHKNELKANLDEKVKAIHRSIKSAQGDVEKMKKDFKKEEVDQILNITSTAEAERKKLQESVTKAEDIMKKLNDAATTIEVVQKDIDRSNIHLNTLLRSNFETTIAEFSDEIETKKEEFEQWMKDKMNMNQYTKVLHEKQEEFEQWMLHKMDVPKYEQNVKFKVRDIENEMTSSMEKLANFQHHMNYVTKQMDVLYEDMQTHAKSLPTQIHKKEIPRWNSRFSTFTQDDVLGDTPPNKYKEFQVGDRVTYEFEKGQFKINATVISKFWESSLTSHVYKLSADQSNQVLEDCEPSNIELLKDGRANARETSLPYQSKPSRQSLSEQPQPTVPETFDLATDDDSTDDLEEHQGTWNKGKSNMNDNEFEYPINTNTRRISIPLMLKNADRWNFNIRSKQDLKQFYSDLQIRLLDFNILLVPYTEIKENEIMTQITPTNCLNYHSASKVMSRAIYTYIDENKSSLFSIYEDPLHTFDAFRHSMDGIGFLKEILSDIHPRLKAPTSDIAPVKPVFAKYANIHLFINAYREWLSDEKAKGRTYSDKENISYVLTNLDERFEQAIIRINREIHEIFDHSPTTAVFPEKWTVRNKRLSLDINKLITSNDGSVIDLTNDDVSPTVNKVQFDEKSRRKRYNTRSRKDYATPQENNYKGKSNKGQGLKENKNRHKWAKDIKWKYMPGAHCPACGKTDHSIYETGCPQMAIFAKCQKFMSQHDSRDLEPVLQEFEKYQAELSTKKRRKRKEYKDMVKTLDGSPEIRAEIKRVFQTAYYNDFPEEMDNEVDLDDASDTESDSEDSTSSDDSSTM